MAEIGQIRKDKWFMKYVWIACPKCGKERWVQLLKGNPVSNLCKACSSRQTALLNRGERSKCWKGGRRNHK